MPGNLTVLLLVVADHRPGRIDAAATATPDRQLHLDLAQAARALIDCATDLTIGNPMADADVHGKRFEP
jgi:hypothetical protein